MMSILFPVVQGMGLLPSNHAMLQQRWDGTRASKNAMQLPTVLNMIFLHWAFTWLTYIFALQSLYKIVLTSR
jgi:hypothetical protein